MTSRRESPLPGAAARLSRSLVALILALLGVAWGQPAPRADPAMAYDHGSQLVVLYGGEGAATEALGDTWVFDPATGAWAQRTPRVSPPPLREHVMAYDSQSDRIVVWGGYAGSGPNRELWSYDTDADTWTRVEQAGPQPRARIDSAAVYAPEIDQIVLVAGLDPVADFSLADTWLLDLDSGRWTEVETEPSISTRESHALVYAPDAGVVVLFGGEDFTFSTGSERVDRIWLFDPRARTWTERPEIEHPERYAAGGLAALGDGALLHYGGGPFGSAETWRYDMTEHRWTRLDAATPGAPGALSRFAMISLPGGDALLFGGVAGFRSDARSDATWRFDSASSTWSRP